MSLCLLAFPFVSIRGGASTPPQCGVLGFADKHPAPHASSFLILERKGEVVPTAVLIVASEVHQGTPWLSGGLPSPLPRSNLLGSENTFSLSLPSSRPGVPSSD